MTKFKMAEVRTSNVFCSLAKIISILEYSISLIPVENIVKSFGKAINNTIIPKNSHFVRTTNP